MTQYKVELLPAAYSDLDEIFDYILAENPQAAMEMLNRIMNSLRHLQIYPNSGAPLFERSLKKLNFRMVIVTPYIAFYRFLNNKVLVYRILHGTRSYTHLLKNAVK
jgi:plasmid stabilization system protein ParE